MSRLQKGQQFQKTTNPYDLLQNAFIWLLVPIIFVWIPVGIGIACSFAAIRFHSFLSFSCTGQQLCGHSRSDNDAGDGCMSNLRNFIKIWQEIKMCLVVRENFRSLATLWGQGGIDPSWKEGRHFTQLLFHFQSYFYYAHYLSGG